MWTNANGERIEKIEAQERAASADCERRGVVIAECPYCRASMEVRLDGSPSKCEGDDHLDEAGCGRSVTIADLPE